MKRLHFGCDSLLKCLVVMGLLALGLLPIPVAAQPFAYVADFIANDFAVINTSAAPPGVVPPFIPNPTGMDSLPQQVAITPDGAYVWATNAFDSLLSVISTATNSGVALVPVPTVPLGVAINPVADANGRIDAYVTDEFSFSVLVIDTGAALTNPTNAVVSTVLLPTGTAPFGVAITPNGTTAYVTDISSNRQVFVIDTATAANPATAGAAIVGTIQLTDQFQDPLIPYAVAISPDGAHAYVTTGNSSLIAVIDTTTNSVVATPTAAGGTFVCKDIIQNCFIDSHTSAVALTPDGAHAYVTFKALFKAPLLNTGVGVIDTATNQGVATIPVGDNPLGVAITPDGSSAYVTNNSDNTVSIINTALNTTVGTPIPVDTGPEGIAMQGPVRVLPSTGVAALSGVPVGLTVTGANASLVGSVTWDFFGNGAVVQKTSTLHTQFIYPGAGTFTPKVTVLNRSGVSLLVKKIPVHIQSPGQAVLTAITLVKLLRPLTVVQQASLISPLNSALQALNLGDRTTAYSQVGLFINKQTALVPGGQLTATAAAPAFGEGEAIQIALAKTVMSPLLGTSEFTPQGGSSEVGDPVTFTVTWTVPSGKSWRDLQYLDLRLAEREEVGEKGEANKPLIALWARFYVGTSTFVLLDANGNLVGVGLPGSKDELESSTATLDLGPSSFQGTGPTGPSVTVNFAVRFKAAAAGEDSARVYGTELLASDVAGEVQGREDVGHWVVRPLHQ